MSADDFFSRWSRKAAKPEPTPAQEQDRHAVKTTAGLSEEPRNAAEIASERPVTLEDVAGLTNDSDYSPFVARGVSETVKRSAMKKLFSDPHFNVMDRLDIYIDDYSVFEPITPAALAMMEHAKPLLDPLKQVQNSILSLIQETEGREGNAVAANDNEDEDGMRDSLLGHADVEQATPQEAKLDGSVEAPTQMHSENETFPVLARD